MKILHVLGHNYKWNLDAYRENGIGNGFLISAFTFGTSFLSEQRVVSLLGKSLVDLQFYGKRAPLKKGHLSEFDFHPINNAGDDVTSVCLSRCMCEAIRFQEKSGLDKVVIPISYEANNCKDILGLILLINEYLRKNKKEGVRYYMTLPFSYDIIRDSDRVDSILAAVTDVNVLFDGFFVVCETKPEQGHKITVDSKTITNLSLVFKTLKNQNFETIYGYANWDSIIYLAQTDIDYITIGTFENLRNFFIKRFTQDLSGGASKGYYFSEKLLNMVKAQDIENIRHKKMLPHIKNSKNIFSDIILGSDYVWSTQKPDVNKNYLLSISKLLLAISEITDIKERTLYVLYEIESAKTVYKALADNYVALASSESQNYHLEVWKQYLLGSIKLKPDEFSLLYSQAH